MTLDPTFPRKDYEYMVERNPRSRDDMARNQDPPDPAEQGTTGEQDQPADADPPNVERGDQARGGRTLHLEDPDQRSER
jgi:hypothetical protein